MVNNTIGQGVCDTFLVKLKETAVRLFGLLRETRGENGGVT